MPGTRDEQYDEFVSLLGLCENRIRRFVRSLMIQGDAIDDIMQDVSLECWKKFDSFTPQGDDSRVAEFIRWACVIARFKVLSRIRDASRERLLFREGLLDVLSEQSVATYERRSNQQRVLEGCLDKMPTDDRRLILSVHVPGESVANIARRTGINARKLYSRINVLRGKLLNCVQSQLAGE